MGAACESDHHTLYSVDGLSEICIGGMSVRIRNRRSIEGSVVGGLKAVAVFLLKNWFVWRDPVFLADSIDSRRFSHATWYGAQ